MASRQVGLREVRTTQRQLGLVLFAIACFLPLAQASLATTLYVAESGSDAADGHSPKSAFHSLQHAANLTQPGDTVFVMNGTYTAARPTEAALAITHSGTADRWITFKAMPGQAPKIVTRGWNAIDFGGKAAYVEVNGFTVIGNNDNVTLAGALKRGNRPDPDYDGNCISADGRKGSATEKPHHLRILNNVLGKCGGGGIALIQTDYVTISGNTVYDCSWYSIYGTSGISTLEDWNSDDATGYKMIITHNKVFGNKELVPWVDAGKITDGEGIIIDTLRSPARGAYKGRTLVADNVIYANGSAAIEVFRSDHVDVLNNSTYADVQQAAGEKRGEMNLNEAGDVHVANNIFYSLKGENPVSLNASKPCDCTLSSNIYFNGANLPATLVGSKDVIADPLYINLDLSNPWQVDLRVAAGSPSIGAGYCAGAMEISRTVQPRGARCDRAAYQQQQPAESNNDCGTPIERQAR